MFGYEREEMIGQPVEIIIPERFRSAHGKGFRRAMAGEVLNLGGKAVEVYALKKDGTELPIELTLCAWHDGREMGAGAVIKDITERRERDGRLLRLANQDVLTGLPNRNRFLEILAIEIVAQRPITIVILSIDSFTDVNDTLGHPMGDALLQSVAIRLSHRLAQGAQLARFGSNEFAVLLRHVGEPEAALKAAGVVGQSFAKPYTVSAHLLDLTASMGVAVSPTHGTDAEELVASADLALHRAKSSRTKKLRIYDHSMRSEATARRALRDELLSAYRNGDLVLYYQPQVHFVTGQIFGVEALLRWNHPQRGLLQPGKFLPALEQSVLAIEVGWWILDEACKAATLMNAVSPFPVKMGVNLFAAQLSSPILCNKVRDSLTRNGLPASLLELEVTETIALGNDDRSLDVMTALREIGVGIAFDDFGTGYASLSSLQRYPLTTLKIDRGFVSDLTTKSRDAAIIRALIAMSLEMGLETIAEGIETAEQEECLIALGCPAAQGYRYGKPMPFYDIVKILRESGDD